MPSPVQLPTIPHPKPQPLPQSIPHIRRAKQWPMPQYLLSLPALFKCLSPILERVQGTSSQTRSTKRVAIKSIETMTIIMVVTCAIYLITVWQIINPFEALIDMLSIDSNTKGYSIERVSDAPNVQISQLSSKGIYAEINVPPSV